MNNYKTSLYSAIIRICANVIMVGAVFLAMYQASHWPGWPSEAVFCLFFFGITIPAWVIAWVLIRHIRRNAAEPEKTLVNLPNLGPQLVSWRVAQPAFEFDNPQLNQQ